MKIIAIDPGLKHLGWSYYDSESGEFRRFGLYNLVEGQPKQQRTKYAYLVREFVTKSKSTFDEADAIVIEIQMTAKFKVIQTAFQCFFWDKAHLVSPRSVRCHFDISMGDYAKNKKASVQKIPTLGLSKRNMAWFEKLRRDKCDDVADAMLIALYWAEVGAEKAAKRARKRKRQTIE